MAHRHTQVSGPPAPGGGPLTVADAGNGRVAELDGLRGLAALSVVVAHYFGEGPHGLRAFTFGWIGVDVFFVLSGFLIGSIILKGRDEPHFLASFYLRRALRILPIYMLTIGAVFLFLALAGAGRAWIDAPLPLGSYLTFSQNFAMLAHAETGGDWLLPTWTLAVEEQFYLIAPLLICFLPRRHLPVFLVAGIAAAVLLRIFFQLTDASWMASLVLLPSRMDLLLCGVLAAWLLQAQLLAGEKIDMALRLIPLACAIALIPVVAAEPWTGVKLAKILAPLLLGVGSAALILALVRGAPEGRRFRSGILGFFGTISYGLYLIHQPVAGILHGLILDARPDIGTTAAFAVTLAAFAASVALAWVSWRWMEAPLIALGRRRRYGQAEESSVAGAREYAPLKSNA